MTPARGALPPAVFSQRRRLVVRGLTVVVPEVAGGLAHEALCRNYHNRAVEAVAQRFPNPGGLDAEALQNAAVQDADLNEVLDVVRLFQWLLPGLGGNVAYLRHQLLES